MESPWTTKKRWLYKIQDVFCHEGSLVLNHAYEEEALDQLGQQGWEVFQIEKKEYKNLEINEHSIHDYSLRVYCKKERL